MSRRVADGIEAEKAQRPEARGDARLDWWRQARFGAFIHWGLYALPDPWPERPDHGGWWTQEWLMHVKRIPVRDYESLARSFSAPAFDPDAWVSDILAAGMRYLVFTAKHHDGFCLFRSSATAFTSVAATRFARDAVGELAAACRRAELPFGVYYSQTQDWHHPHGYGNDWDFPPEGKDFERYLRELVEPQLAELLGNYGDIAVLWFDTPTILSRDQGLRLRDLVHRLQPACLVNGRIGNGLGDYATTRDNQFLSGASEQDWECPATMNRTWGYRSTDQDWKPVAEILDDLADVNAKNGNYLLNIGPDGEGRFPVEARRILHGLGRHSGVRSPRMPGSRP